jgi:transcriptional regulator with XRE-family HTH domain
MLDNGDDDRSKTPEGVFGKALKHFREQAGLSLSQLAALSSYSTTVISKIENGRRPPAENFPERMDAITQLETHGHLSLLWGWLKESVRQRAYPGWFGPWPTYEIKATVLRTYEPLLVPGLFQTEDYARAVLRTRLNITEEEIEETVEGRVARQGILSGEKPPMVWAMIDESVLRRPVGGQYVMREQVNRLAEAARRPNVVIQFIPMKIGASEGLRGGGFVVAEFADHAPVAYQDTAVRGMIIDSADDVASLMVMWDTIKTEALPRAASADVIEEAAKIWT